MNTDKYKSIVVDIDTYESIKAQALDDERNISNTLKKYFFLGVEKEIDECSIDSELIDGGTPRLHRLLEDLRYYQDNASTKANKKYIVDSKEKEAIAITISAIADTIE